MAKPTLRMGGRLAARRTHAYGGIRSVYRVERRKLANQLAIRLLALACLLGPFAFAAVLRVQSGTPADTLFGAWVHSSGFAISLVVLGFASTWGFPLIAGIVAGDIFSAEDRHRTWKTILTRSRSRAQVFLGKLLAAATFSLALTLLAAVSSLLAGLLLIGDQPLPSLSGTLFSPARTLGLTSASWLLCVPPMLAFASLAVLFSVIARNGIAGVLGPSLVGLAMQLLLLVGAGIWAHTLLVASAFDGWHGLFRGHPFYGPSIVAIIVSVIWTAACLLASWLIYKRRDYAGTPATRRPGWAMPIKVTAAFAIVVAFLALASNWGPAGVTAARLEASIAPTFNNLTLLQQRLLGRSVPNGVKLFIRPLCSRRASKPEGPGEWSCTLEVLVPQPGAMPYYQAPVDYDVSVQSDGCYKADSPPYFIGPQTMRDAHGKDVVNPLFTFYGCFDVM